MIPDALTDLAPVIAALDYASVFVFAITGALVASRAQLDIVGFVFVAALTAVGGGTLRDVLLNRPAVFWITDPAYIAVAGAAAVLVFFTAHRLDSRRAGIVWFDALALAVAVPAGVAVARAMGMEWPIVLVMGITTGCFGGLARDVVCNEMPLVLKQGELYVTCALAGATAAVLAQAAGLSGATPLALCGVVTFALRAGGIARSWRLPVYRSTPPRG